MHYHSSFWSANDRGSGIRLPEVFEEPPQQQAGDKQ
jgi:hypothetical protein